MTKLIYLLNSQQSFVDIFIENLKNNAIPVLLVGPILLAIVFVIYGVKSDWFAKLFGVASKVTGSRIALQDYLKKIEILIKDGGTTFPLNQPMSEKNGSITPATIIEDAIQSIRTFNDPSIKNWQELYEADLFLTQKHLQNVLQYEILLRLSQYSKSSLAIINTVKSINEFWALVTKGEITENEATTVLYAPIKSGYGTVVHKEADRPVFTIDETFIEHPLFIDFLEKLRHEAIGPDMNMAKIENVLKESNMADAPIVFKDARKILADRWMELFNESMHKIDLSSTPEDLWTLYQKVEKMKTTVDAYLELVDISEILETKKSELYELWKKKYRSLLDQKLLVVASRDINETLSSLTDIAKEIQDDVKKYDMTRGMFEILISECLKTAFEISEESSSHAFLKQTQEWLSVYDSPDERGYKAKIQERFDSFVQNVPVPTRDKKLKVLKEA